MSDATDVNHSASFAFLRIRQRGVAPPVVGSGPARLILTLLMDERAPWLHDSVVGFLESPQWKVPVMEFIDRHCIIFDTEEENKFEYTQ